MVNLCTFIGNLGKDPEFRSISTGVKVANFSIACSEKWNDKDGNSQEKTEWINITCWRGLAEVVEKYCKKGMRVYVQGKFNTQSWDDNGTKRYKSFILADTIKFLSKGEGSTAKPSQSSKGGGGQAPEDDLPF